MSDTKIGNQSNNVQQSSALNIKTMSKAQKKVYDGKMEALSAQIIDPPRNTNDLRHNAEIEEQLIRLAQSVEDKEKETILNYELNEINKEIRMNSSIFNK